MRGLEASQLLELHERGHGLPPVRRALLLLETALPEASAERLAALPVGRRDERILEVRARTLGSVIQTETRCPACSERLELDLRSEEFRAESPGEVSLEPPEPLTVRHEEYEVVVRLPSSVDLVEVAEGAGTEGDLLSRCVVEASRGGATVPAGDLPAPVMNAVEAAMAEADPLADLQLALTCPACGHDWQSALDPTAFFWDEIEAFVPRLLREVHLLASAYGWSEREILGMGAWRRGQYLRFLTA